MFHADNAYFLPEFRIHTRRVKTNTVSNTAFRGFGGPQGMMAIERVIDAIAWESRPRSARRAQGQSLRRGRDVTPYGQTVEDYDVAPRLIEQLERSSSYRARRKEIAAFNARSPILKRGIALTPVKFGISFTLTHLNQAGALVHVYQDGSVHLNHGGTEMGQGLFQKVAQVAAEEFGIGLERVHITATSTDKVPNTSATAASSGTDLNGMAVQQAVREIKGAAGALCRGDLERRRGSHLLPRRPRVHRQREHSVRRIDQEGAMQRACICRPPASTRRRSCIGIARKRKAGRSSITPMAPPAAKS